jgi:hypothetical protein
MSRKISGILYLLSFLVFPWMVLSPAVSLTDNLVLRLAIFCVLAAVGTFLFRRTWPSRGWGVAVVITVLGYGMVYKVASFFPDVSSYPFSLGWSEGSRYYYASLWLSQQVYGLSLPPSVLHPSRYLLQAIPFLIPGASLWLNRLWQVMLWVVTTGLTSYLLVRRLHLPLKGKTLVFALGMFLWGFLFIFLGPIYYHLQVMLIVILWGFNKDHPWRNLLLVLAASIWAGISRVNWLPVPGMLAAMLFLLEETVSGTRIWKYLAAPVLWVVFGSGLGYASQRAYQALSGNPLAWFGSSFTSDLLWYRLLPNVTYPLGIVLSAFLVSVPIIGLMAIRLKPRWGEFHPIRLLGVAAILGVLLGGGILVSVKIGGGSNLHNLDAYLALLMVSGGYIYFDRFIPDIPTQPAKLTTTGRASGTNLQHALETICLAATLVIPLYFTLTYGGKLPEHDFQAAQAALKTISSATQHVAGSGGEVLFISQRQLLTFDEVKNIPLVPEDELVFLMEMAMSNNRDYLDAFQKDVSSQRFEMIVSEPLVIQYQGKSHVFGEENDAWVKNVSTPVLCYYEPSTTLDAVGLVLYTPRTTPCN